MKFKKTYVYVTGGKGGIAKSTTALAIADFKAQSGKVLLLDSDPTNADSSTPYKAGKDENVQAMRIQLRSEDADGQIDTGGLSNSLNLAMETDAETIIVDAPAGDTLLLVEAGDIITEACREAKIKSVIVWLVVASTEQPLIACAKRGISSKRADLVLIVKTLKEGNNFDFFDESPVTIDILKSANVKMIEVPLFAKRLGVHLKIDRMTLEGNCNYNASWKPG